MKRKVIAAGLLFMVLLTGCGKENWVEQYTNADEISSIDRPEDMQRAENALVIDDNGQPWEYRRETIDRMADMEKNLKKICCKKTSVYSEADSEYEDDEEEDDEDEDIPYFYRLQQRMMSGADPKQESAHEYDIIIECNSYKDLVKDWNALADTYFPSLKGKKPDGVSCMEKECRIRVSTKKYMKEEEEWDIQIDISDISLFGPVRYFEFADFCAENQLFISKYVCEGGAVDYFEIAMTSSYVKIFMKEDKILEISLEYNMDEAEDEYSYDPPIKLVEKQEIERLARLLGRMSGDEAGALELAKKAADWDGEYEQGKLGNRTYTFGPYAGLSSKVCKFF